MDNERLTTREYWDDYWISILLPLEIKRSKRNLLINEILNVFDKYLQVDKNLSILEIGGSPGQYLAYMHKQFGYILRCLDYSEIGCDKTDENFRLLNIPIQIYQNDLFSENSNLSLSDIVYSLGLVEHFADLNSVIEQHVKLLKPGGMLIIGVPNFLGINQWFLKRLAPILLSGHNLDNMDIINWNSFEKKFKLITKFKGYIGGFEPNNLNRWEERNFINLVLKSVVKLLSLLLSSHFRFLRKFNSKYFSGYLIGIYEKPSE